MTIIPPNAGACPVAAAACTGYKSRWRRSEVTGRFYVTEYLTIEEVCELLRLSDRSVYDLCRKGKLPGAAKVGGVWRVERAKLTAWLEAGGDADFRQRTEEDR